MTHVSSTSIKSSGPSCICGSSAHPTVCSYSASSLRPAAQSNSTLVTRRVAPPKHIIQKLARRSSSSRYVYVLPTSTVIDIWPISRPVAVGQSSLMGISTTRCHKVPMNDIGTNIRRHAKDVRAHTKMRWVGRMDELIRISRDQPVTYQSTCTSQSKNIRSNITNHQHTAKIS